MKKILVVEDTVSIREEIVDIFKMEGYQVIEAINGLEGLNKAIKEKPDLIVSDILMPKLNGYKMLNELHKHSITASIPLIFLTAKAENMDIRKGMNLGADDYLIKPLNPNDLILTVQKKLKKQEIINSKFNDLRNNIYQSLPHELNTPLNSILGFSSLIKESPHDYNKESIIEMVSYIYDSGVRLNKIIKNILLYSNLRIKASDLSNKKRKNSFIDTKDIIESKVKEIGENENRLSDIIIDLSEFKLNISSEHLLKIIEELINNGIKFSVAGDIIKISSGKEMQYFFISVRNEGVGLSHENIVKIDGFMQFDRQKMEQQGLGLGLSIVKLLTSIYNGEIEIDSRSSEYFNIKISFPQ